MENVLIIKRTCGVIKNKLRITKENIDNEETYFFTQLTLITPDWLVYFNQSGFTPVKAFNDRILVSKKMQFSAETMKLIVSGLSPD
jgi:hypothetical protein